MYRLFALRIKNILLFYLYPFIAQHTANHKGDSRARGEPRRLDSRDIHKTRHTILITDNKIIPGWPEGRGLASYKPRGYGAASNSRSHSQRHRPQTGKIGNNIILAYGRHQLPCPCKDLS